MPVLIPDRSCEAGRFLLAADYRGLVTCLTVARDERPPGAARDGIDRVLRECLHSWWRGLRRAGRGGGLAGDVADRVAQLVRRAATQCLRGAHAVAESRTRVDGPQAPRPRS